jgi:hypothetical protein
LTRGSASIYWIEKASNQYESCRCKEIREPSGNGRGGTPKPVLKDGFTLVRMHLATINQLSNTIRKGELGTTEAPLLGNEMARRGQTD